MPKRTNRLHRWLLLAVLYVVDHPRRVLAIAAVAVIGCVLLALAKLTISTDQDEVFSSKIGFFRDYKNFAKDFPENQANYVIIEAKDSSHPTTARWTEAADAITAALARQTQWVVAVQGHVPLDQLGAQGVLLDNSAAMQQDFSDLTKLAVPWQKSTLLTRVLGSTPTVRFLHGIATQQPNADTAAFLSLLAEGWTRLLQNPDEPIALGKQVPNLTALGMRSPRELGYDFIPDGTDSAKNMLLIPVYERDDFSARNGLSDTIDGIRSTIYTAAAPFTEFTVGLSGRPTLEADEMRTTDTDARWSEIAALSAVFVGLVLLLRSLWLAVAAEIALLIGIAWTFGWATISIGQLNLLSMVFLIALTGIGMDYLIQVLTRYRRESARRSNPRAIWIGVFKYVAAPINTACLGAAGAFLVALFTNFRGAAELGVIAGGGLLLCLLTGYVILPPLLVLFPAKARPEDSEHSVQHLRVEGKSRHRRLLWPALWAILLMAAIPFASRAVFNPSLLELQAANLESVKLVRKLPTWSAVVLSRDLNQLRIARTAVTNLPVVKDTDSILRAYDNYDWLIAHQASVPTIATADYEPITTGDLPSFKNSVANLAEKFRLGYPDTAKSLDMLAAMITDAPPAVAAARLSGWQQTFIEQLRQLLVAYRPAPFNPALLPVSLRSHYIGTDGQMALYINPSKDLWVQANLARFTGDVESAVSRTGPAAPTVTGIAINVFHSTSSIQKSFYHAAIYALVLIFLLVLVDLKNLPQTILAISVLAMGLPMLVALMGLLGINWNFANFFGLPILIGAGHEYGVFMVHRYNEAIVDAHRPWRRWDVSDKALLSCAYVTSVSFGFFWLLGHHEGLKSLGLVMALGIGCIYLATLCVLRPLLLWKLDKKNTPAR